MGDFHLQAVIKTLHRGIVMAITALAHAANQFMPGKQTLIPVRTILIGYHDQSAQSRAWEVTLEHRHGQYITHQGGDYFRLYTYF